jgi:hypothetical protein
MNQPSRFTRYLLLVALLLILFAQMIFASPQQSASFDETYRITFGYAYLRTGDARLSRGQNPPLADVILAAPLLLRTDIVLPLDQPAWVNADVFGFSDEFLWKANSDKAQQLVMLARLPSMFAALMLATLIFVAARRWIDPRAGWLALVITVFDPNVIAHGRVAGNDLMLTMFVLGAVLAFDHALTSNSKRSIVMAGVLCGAALASKYSALWLMPILIVWLLLRKSSATWRRRVIYLLAVGTLSLVVIWITFDFQIGPLAPNGLPLLAPDYWQSIANVQNRVSASTPAFLNGQISTNGFLEYYLIAFLVKTPLPTLLLFVVGLMALIRRRSRSAVLLLVAFGLFMLAATIARLDLGYRLILPALPFSLIVAAASIEFISRSRWRLIIGVLIAWLAIGTLAIFPNHLIFFNELVGGSNSGQRILVDSNFDWGQDLITLRGWMQQHQINQIHLAYFGSAHPDGYDHHADLLPSFNQKNFGPEVEGFSSYAAPAGWYAISATSLQLGLVFTHWNAYAAFRDRPPDDRVGSLFLYHISETASRSRVVVLGPPAIDLNEAALGADQPAAVSWAGDGSIVLAMNGSARYITRGGDPIAGFAPDVHAALLANAQKLGNDSSGDLRLFSIDASVALRAKLAALAAAPVQLASGVRSSLPITFPIGLSFIGYDLAQINIAAGNSIDLITYWRVTGSISTSLSVYAHVSDASGKLLGQSDGLNVALSTLQMNDVIMQHHLIPIARSTSAGLYNLSVGLYDPFDQQKFGKSIYLADVPVTRP